MNVDFSLVGSRIAKRRRALTMTQDNLAECTGLSNNYISNIENSRSIPSIETLVKLSQALDTTPDYFLLGTYKNAENPLVRGIEEKLKLCSEKKLKLVDRFVNWIIDENV